MRRQIRNSCATVTVVRPIGKLTINETEQRKRDEEAETGHHGTRKTGERAEDQVQRRDQQWKEIERKPCPTGSLHSRGNAFWWQSISSICISSSSRPCISFRPFASRSRWILPTSRTRWRKCPFPELPILWRISRKREPSMLSPVNWLANWIEVVDSIDNFQLLFAIGIARPNTGQTYHMF